MKPKITSSASSTSLHNITNKISPSKNKISQNIK